MMNKEEYKKEVVRLWDGLRTEYIGLNYCEGVSCKYCPLGGFEGCNHALDSLDIYETVEKWSKEHQPKKYKVSRIEYDFLEPYLKYNLKFYQSKELYALLKKGYFKGATRDMTINYYFDNCEVKEDV